METKTSALPRRIAQLKSLTDIERAMNRIFAEARKGEMDTADMARYGTYLNLLANIMRGGNIEERITALEEQINAKSGKANRFIRAVD